MLKRASAALLQFQALSLSPHLSVLKLCIVGDMGKAKDAKPARSSVKKDQSGTKPGNGNDDLALCDALQPLLRSGELWR